MKPVGSGSGGDAEWQMSLIIDTSSVFVLRISILSYAAGVKIVVISNNGKKKKIQKIIMKIIKIATRPIIMEQIIILKRSTLRQRLATMQCLRV